MGGAKVSEKHANFIVNSNQATAQDILSLIKLIQEKVEEKHAVALHPEIFYLSYEGVTNGISS
jgi:UDP-N-acetylmuramate dehydrogenase